MSTIHAILETTTGAQEALPAPLGGAPSLARLAYNRLGFGPRPSDPDFGDDWRAFVAYLDEQLDYQRIDDTTCEAAVQSLDRRDLSGGLTMPPLDADLRQLQAYSEAYNAQNSDGSPEWERAYFLSTATYTRALLSRRQLFEMMVDFWNNHFHTVPDAGFKCWEDHHVVRRYALGKFRDLLGASAKSPLMLAYLSNAYSDGANPNENYARELMELHTLGSTNRIPRHPWHGKLNYTEEDVHTVAQILSGWTTLNSEYGEFRFNDTPEYPAHHYDEKRLKLDNADYTFHFPYGGIEQGELLLDILARHPSTAYNISRKLCKRLISDDPERFCPGALRAGMNAFLQSEGDIRITLRALVLYREDGRDFKSSWSQKLKRPFECFISAMRALNVAVYPPPFSEGDTWEMYDHQATLGQTLFYWPPPTGFPDVQRAWWNSNQVLSRWTMANALVQRAFDAQGDDWQKSNADLDALIGNSSGQPPNPAQVVDRLIGICFGRRIHPADRAALVSYLGNNDTSAAITSAHPRLRPLLGTLLASPYFQWR